MKTLLGLWVTLLAFVSAPHAFAQSTSASTSPAAETPPTPSSSTGTLPAAGENSAAPVWQSVNIDRFEDEHVHRGFFISLQIGGGYQHITSGQHFSISGGGAALLISVGGTLAENWVLHGEFIGSMVKRPTVESGGERVSLSGHSAHLVGIGGGMTHFFMPINIYVGGALLATSMSLDNDSTTVASTQLGPGGLLKAGKQFWIGREWALDIGPLFHLGAAPDTDNPRWVNGWSAKLMLGASYN